MELRKERKKLDTVMATQNIMYTAEKTYTAVSKCKLCLVS